MVELLAAIGYAGKELFDYNRDIYQFDQGQRLLRELLRLEMQVKRFELFREDIRDLVELTVGKMEMYHVVGALMLWFGVCLYTEGRVRAETPPFLLALYWLSIAGSLVYFLLAVWLSMHASITSHSFGVRLLTRFVRLPIPGVQQFSALNARLTDYERQGAKNLLRVPLMGDSQKWQQRRPDLAKVDESKTAQVAANHGEADPRFQTAVHLPGALQPQDLLGAGERAFGKEDDLHHAAVRLPGKHIQLFRRLQAKWQVYDAYARVCMSLGVCQLLNATCFYLIVLVMIEYHSPSTCFALLVIFESAMLALAFLDISGVHKLHLMGLMLIGVAPVFITATALCTAKRIDDTLPAFSSNPTRKGKLDPTQVYIYSPVPFFLMALWAEGLLHLAWPSKDMATLPRRFRTVLFLDVFALADDATRDGDLPPRTESQAGLQMQEPLLTAEQAAAADEALFVAEAALRRWEAVPAGTSEANAQGQEVARLRREVTIWRKALNGEAARRAGKHGDQDALALLEADTRPWVELSQEERAEDPYAGTLLGPFEHNTMASDYYYDLEAREFVWEVAEGHQVLTLDIAKELVSDAEAQVRAVLGGFDSADAAETGSEDGASPPPMTSGSGFVAVGAPGAAAAASAPLGGFFVQERLPWKVLRAITRTMMVAWIYLGIMQIIEVSGALRNWDKIGGHRWEEPEGGRRLQALAAPAELHFEPVEVAWPLGALFRPEALSCLPDGNGGLLVSSRNTLYQTALPDVPELAPLRLEALPGPALPAGAAALCGLPRESAPSAAAAPCILGAPAEGGIAFWALGGSRSPAEAVVLPLEGKRWRMLAGAAVQCDEVAGLLVRPRSLAEIPPEGEQAWCLLLVGWDGERLPVAAVPLPRGPAEPPSPHETVVPVHDVPLLEPQRPGQAREPPNRTAAVDVASLHVEPVRGRLWALRADGVLQGWELVRPRRLGSWQPAWPTLGAGTFRATALCEDLRSRGLLVAGRWGVAGPQLLRAALPRHLTGAQPGDAA